MRYPPLLIAMFLTMLLKPFAQYFGWTYLGSGVLSLVIFLAAIYAFHHNRRIAACLIIFGALSVTLRFASDHWLLTSFGVVSQISAFIAMLIVIVAILGELLSARTVPTDLVIGAVCLYVAIGLAWVFLYYSLYLIEPGSIFLTSRPGTVTARELSFTEAIYFSFSALTTIGSSGEPPLTQLARQLAVVESAMGQLYLAVLISRLVGFNTAGDKGVEG
jgi:hypothetical protein